MDINKGQIVEASQLRILVADDDPDLLQVTELLLKNENVIVKTAVTGQECLQSIRLEKPDLLLLDAMLPDISGVEICKTIKSDPALSTIKVLLLSGMTTELDSVSGGLETGADGYIIKPLSNRELHARVDSALRLIQVERSLRETQAHTAGILSAVTDIIMEVDTNKIYTWTNQAGYDFFGHDVIGKEAAYYFEGNQQTYDIVQPLFNGNEETFYLESWQRRIDGAKRLLGWWCRVMKDEKGQIKGAVSSARDITERKQVEFLLQEKSEAIQMQNEEYLQLNEELTQSNDELQKAKESTEESEALLRAAMENSQAGIAIAEFPSGKLKYVNKAALMIRAKDYDEIVKDIDLDKYVSSWQILHFDGTPFQSDEVPLARAILYGETNSREFIVRRDNNEDRYVWANAAPIYNDRGIQTAAIVVFLDITESKKVEKALIRSEYELKKAQEITHIGSWYLDLASKVVVWSEELYKMYGFDPALPPPKYTEHMKLFTSESWETLSASLAHTAETGVPYVLELKTVRKDGSNGHMWVRGEALKDDDGNIYGLWGAAQDISERKHLEEDLIKAKLKAEESDRLKSAFLANMSHEIRTPLNGILGFAGLLKEPDLTSQEKSKYIDMIDRGGIRLLNIINDIISISKVESGLMEISLSETNVNDQINYIATFFQPDAAQKGIRILINARLPEKESIIKSDREKIYAVLTNLVKNAVKFTDVGYVEVGCLKKGPFLEFFVRDTGVGVPANLKETIFVRFRQGSDSLSRNYEGAGLGLSISKAYIEMLGGKIWVESEPGKGSTFYFTIPNNASPKNEAADEIAISNHKGPCQIEKLKILVVEDDEASELFIQEAIKMMSREIISTRTGTEAIEACRNNPDIDLVLMDIKMPVMDGYEATRRIREFNKEVVIISQTAYALEGEREKSIDAGCNDYLSKPINKDELLSLIQKYFKSILKMSDF